MVQPNQHRKPATAPAKEFLALTHGHEWVSFYESFDKLVQDHLSRSSELLKKAMSLPEVADREVAQVRQEFETKLSDERSEERQVLNQLRTDIDSSHAQVEAITAGMRSLSGDLVSLKDRVDMALGALESRASQAASTTIKPIAQMAKIEDSKDPEAEAAVSSVEAEPVADAESAGDIEAAVTENEAVERADQDVVDAAASDTVEEIPDTLEGDEPTQDAAIAGANEKRRPHWLSVSRTAQQP